MIVIVVLIGLATVLDGWVAALMVPWRGERNSIRWLLFGLAVNSLAWDGVILLASLDIPVQPLIALAILVSKSAAMAFWVLSIRRARRNT